MSTAADLAEKLVAPLLCAYVDEASYLVEWDPSRSAHRLSLHPEADEDEISALTDELRAELGAALEGRAVDWTLRVLSGDPARALGRLAADVHASMIIVGTAERGLIHRISQALNGSVAAWLSHHQEIPVLMVPPHQGSNREIPE